MGENKIKQLLTSIQKPGSLMLLAVLLFGSIFPQSFALPVKTAEAATGVPLLINFQGRLTNVTGGTNVANGTYNMRFKIYDALTSGTLLWTETRDQAPVHACQKVQVTAGVFNVKLGSCNSLSTVDFTSDSLYLSVDFDGGSGYDGEMSPRKQLVSAPYAINANNVAGSGKIDLTNTATTTVPFKLTANTLTTASGLTLTTTNNSAANTAWTGSTLTFNNNQATTAVSSGSIAGLDIQFNQNTAIAGNTETAARINIKQNDSSSTDATVASLLDLANNDTATGNQITVTDALKITGTNVTNGINLSGTFGTNLITSTNFTVAQSGSITSGTLAGSGTRCLEANNSGVIALASGACSGTTTLQSAYGNDVDGSDATISLTSADDSVIFSNPASSGTDSAFVLQSANLATGVTTNNFKNFFASSTGSFDATSGALTNYGGYFSNTSTRSAGSNAVTNVGLYATASGAQNNYAAIFDAGNVGIGTTTPTGTLEVKSTSSTALVIGPNGATNPGLQVDSSVGSAATGIKITGNAAGSGVTFTAISSGSNENILFRPLGTGSLDIRPTTSGTSFRVLRVSDANPQATIGDDGKLVLAGDIDYHSRIQFRAAGGDGSFEVNSQGGASLIGKFSGTAAGLRFNGDVGIERVGTNAARITNASTGAGKLTVGDSTAGTTSRLTVASDLTASAWGLSGIAIQGTAATYTDSSTAISGTATNAVFNSFGIPTLAATNTSVTTTNAANVYIAGAPAAGTNQTITNAYALWVDAGTTRLDGTLNLSSITGSTQCLNVDTNGNVSGTGSSCGGSTTLQQAYGYDADGSDATISLTTADDSIVVTNPSSSGTDSTFTFKIDQAASGAVDALSILNAGTGALILADNSNASGNGVSIDIQSSSASQYGLKVTANNGATNALWVGGDGRVGINNTAPATLLTVGNGTPTSASSGLQFGGDTSANLYRSAAATIKTDGTLNVVTALQLNTNSQLVRYTDGTHGNMVRIYDTADNRGQLLLSPNGTPTFTRSRLVLSMTDLPADGTNFGMFTLAARADDSAYWLSTERGGTGSLFPIKFRINDGGSYSDIMYLGTDGKVGIGDTSPASLFTVGSGDLFQINTTGQIGSQVAPTSDYLFSLAGTTSNDHSRIINITQANDAAEDSYAIAVTNTVNTGTIAGSTTRIVRNQYFLQTPTGTAASTSGGIASLNLIGTDQNLDISSITLGNSSASSSLNQTYGTKNYIYGTPVINNADAAGDTAYHRVWGTHNVVNLTPTLTAASDVTGSYYGTYNNVSITSSGASGYVPSVYGSYNLVTGNLTITGSTYHFGGYYDVSGSAVINYGIYANVSGATTNYAGIFTGGNVGIGLTAPTQGALVVAQTEAANDEAIYIDTEETTTTQAVIVLESDATTADSVKFQVTANGAITSATLAGSGTRCLQTDNAGLISVAGAACGSGGGTLQDAYNGDADGSDATISLTTADDSVVISNPSSSGTDSAFVLKVEQLNTGIATDSLSVTNAGTGALILADNTNASGNGISIDIQSSSASQYGLRVTANNGATNALWVGGDGRVGIGTTVPGTALDVIGAGTFQRNNIGTTSTDGLILSNSTAAGAGAQQYSPRLRLTGQGWKTDTTAASQTVDFALETQPVQGTASPTGNLAILRQINGGGYSSVLTVSNAGRVTSLAADDGNPIFAANNTGISSYVGGLVLIGGSSGQIVYAKNSYGVQIGNSNPLGWVASGWSASPDTAIGRVAAGVVRISSGFNGSGALATGAGKLTVGDSTAGTTSRLTVASDLSATAWGLNGIQLQAAAATYTDSSTAVSGTATNAVFNSFAIPTLAATNATVTTTNAATVYIAGAPTTGTNQTITNASALWTQNGNILLNTNSTFTPRTYTTGFDTSGQNINTTFVSGKYAYIGQSVNAGTCSGATVTGCEFSIFDIHNPSNPIAVSGVNVADTVNTVFVSGKYAYVGKNSNAGTCSGTTFTGCEFQIYDISNPSAPTAVVGYSFNQNLNSIFVQGKFAYLGFETDNTTGAEFVILDLTVLNGTTVSAIGSIDTADATAGEGSVKSVYVQGRYAYLGLSSTTGTACTSGDATSCDFRIYDVSNPFSPTFRGGTNPGITVNSVTASGKYAYAGFASVSGNDFQIYNIADPTAPTATAGSDLSTGVLSVQIVNKYAYIGKTSASGNDFQILDITDPTATPVDAGGVDVTFDVRSVFVSGKYAYIGIANTASAANEFRVLDIAGVDTPTITAGAAGIGQLSVTDNARIENELTVGTALNVGLGGINTAGPVTIESVLTGQSSGAGVAGIYGNYTFNNSTNSVFQYGNRFVANITAVEDSNVDSTYIGQLIRIVDSDCDTGATALDCDNTVRGLEVQSWTGNNTAGTNTAIAGFGKTFGIQGTTDALAGGVSQPAAVFADLDNGSAATVGNAIRAYTNNATSADLVSFYQETTAYTGTGLLMNFGNNSGSYTGNFIDLQKTGSSKYKINYNNGSDITTETFARTGSITDYASATNGNTYIWKIPQKATTGTCATATAEGMIFQNTGGTQVGHICIDGPTSGTPNKLRFYAEQFNATSTDLAENYSDSSGILMPGEVVSFDTTKDKAVVQANTENSENLAGIISTAPGLLLTDASEDGTPSELVNPKPLAISGRVPVKVTDENGIVKKGDHLTVSLTKPGFAMKATKAGITLGQAISDSKDGQVTIFVNLTTWNGKKSGLPKQKNLTGGVKIPTELLKELSDDNSEYLSEIFTDRVVARDLVSDTISTNTLSVASLKFIEKDGLSLDNAFIMKGGLKVDSISSITDLIKMNSDVEFIGTPYFNKDTAGFAKIIAGTREIRIEFEKEYIVKPIVTANLSFERDENTREDDQIKNEELDVQAAFSGVQFVIINKNTKGFTILLNKKAPRDLTFSWIALAVKDAATFVSKDLTAEEKAQEQEQEQEQIKERTPTEEPINTTEETKKDATQSTKENSDQNEKIKVETKEELEATKQ